MAEKKTRNEGNGSPGRERKRREGGGGSVGLGYGEIRRGRGVVFSGENRASSASVC